MPITQSQYQSAQAVQHGAAHDTAQQIRLLAGPGTGKSFSIGERVTWLLNNGAIPTSIWAISFTNASTDDLREGIQSYCSSGPDISDVNISTLHSLALYLLAKGGKLQYYPAKPRVLDEWEQRHIFDEELKSFLGCSIKRCGEIRTHFEAIWSTKNPPAPFISSPTTPITPQEQDAFTAFYRRTTQMYSCLLPGEAVRKCVEFIEAGTLDPMTLIGIEHLVVDEYQDLNPADIELIDLLVDAGITLFVCGDDDQSIYSFRYAYPIGIQQFDSRHPQASSHTLPTCFRCANAVMQSAASLITSYASSTRLQKNLVSAYIASAPPVDGRVIGLMHPSAEIEAQALAESVSDIIDSGIEAESILILLSSRTTQLPAIEEALDSKGILTDIQRPDGVAAASGVRFVYALLRACFDTSDYLARRTLLSLQRGVGIKTCTKIVESCQSNNLNFLDQFIRNRSPQYFGSKEIKALDGIAGAITAASAWQDSDLLSNVESELNNILATLLKAEHIQEWNTFAPDLPAGITLREVLDILGQRSASSTRDKLCSVYVRLGLSIPQGLDPEGRVRIMTLHSCKGLSAKVVFIPGLEDEILPGSHRLRFPGQIEEGARLLYVGLTRARAAVVCSLARRRIVNGSHRWANPSRYISSLGIQFESRSKGLSEKEISSITHDCSNLF